MTSQWYTYEQKSVCIQFTIKNLYNTIQTNVAFDKIDNLNMPRVLADFQVAKCNGPCDSLHVHDACVKGFKIASQVVLVAISFHYHCT